MSAEDYAVWEDFDGDGKEHTFYGFGALDAYMEVHVCSGGPGGGWYWLIGDGDASDGEHAPTLAAAMDAAEDALRAMCAETLAMLNVRLSRRVQGREAL